MGKRGSTVGLEKGLFHNYLANTRKRKIPIAFELTFEEFSAIIHRACYICGSPPGQRLSKPRYKNPAVLWYNGIDRVDNTLGYVLGNVQACCKKCNSVKSDMRLDELKIHLNQMLRGL